MINITPTSCSISFPVFAVTHDGCVALYGEEQQFTTVIGKGASRGEPLPGYIGMSLIDKDGHLFSILAASKGRDIGPLYPGFSLGRFIFRTRRLEADVSISFMKDLSIAEGKKLVLDAYPAIARSIASTGGNGEALAEAIRGSQSFSDLMIALREGGLG